MAQAKTLADVHARIRTCQSDGTQRAVTICFLGDSNSRGMALDPDRAARLSRACSGGTGRSLRPVRLHWHRLRHSGRYNDWRVDVH